MSVKINENSNDFQICDRCQRRYHIEVYQRHIAENQCLKRNHRRLPFQSIKQRTVRVGDRIFSVEQLTKNQQETSRETTTQARNNHFQPATISKIKVTAPNNHRRTLEQAKQLLERRTKYQPPWIKRESKKSLTNDLEVHQRIKFNQAHSLSKLRETSTPPTTRFVTDDLPVRSIRLKSIGLFCWNSHSFSC